MVPDMKPSRASCLVFGAGMLTAVCLMNLFQRLCADHEGRDGSRGAPSTGSAQRPPQTSVPDVLASVVQCTTETSATKLQPHGVEPSEHEGTMQDCLHGGLDIEACIPVLPEFSMQLVLDSLRDWVAGHDGAVGAGCRLLESVFDLDRRVHSGALFRALQRHMLQEHRIVLTSPSGREFWEAVQGLGERVVTVVSDACSLLRAAPHGAPQLRALLTRAAAVAQDIAQSGGRLSDFPVIKQALLQCLEADFRSSPGGGLSAPCTRAWEAVVYMMFACTAPHLLRNEPVEHLLQALSQGTPSPGGGPASALTAAQGAALLSKACEVAVTRGAHSPEWALAVTQARAAVDAFVALAAKDMASYAGLMAVLKCPSGPAEDSLRTQMLEMTLYNATLVPVQVAKKCSEVMQLSLTVAELCPSTTTADVGAAMHLMGGAAATAIQNALVNCSLWARKSRVPQERMHQLRAQMQHTAAELQKHKLVADDLMMRRLDMKLTELDSVGM